MSLDFTQLKMSDYASKLSATDLVVYLDKLTISADKTLPDPYVIDKKSWINDPKLWPDIGYPDIYNYFVQSSNYYSNEQMKCYKSMDAYQYFVCGHVQPVLFYDTGIEDFTYLMAELLPSQRQGTKNTLYKAYLILRKDGRIHTTHCTCMAGAGKACSHAAAIAYKVEAAIRMGLNVTASTSSLCKWNDMSRRKAEPAPVSCIDFKRPKYGDDVRQPLTKSSTSISPCGTLDFNALKRIQPNAAIFTLLEVKVAPQVPKTIKDSIKSLQFNKMTPDEILSSLSEQLSIELVSNLEQMTVKQSQSSLWSMHREGRVTSSRMHRVFTLRDTTERSALVDKILHHKRFSTSATKYSLDMEAFARKTYQKYHTILHDNFLCLESGLVLNKKYPHLGASPDGIVQCSCCGKGCLEIKCLETFENGVPQPDSFIAKSNADYPINENFELKKTHKFYTQVQGHLLICNLEYCDLYLWSKSSSVGVRVYKDDTFIDKMLKKLTLEYKRYILPAIIENIK